VMLCLIEPKEGCMPQGAIEMILSSLGSDRPDPWYFVFFVPYEGASTPIRNRQLTGVDALKNFLLELGIAQEQINEALANLAQFKSASIQRVTILDEQLGSFDR